MATKELKLKRTAIMLMEAWTERELINITIKATKLS